MQKPKVGSVVSYRPTSASYQKGGKGPYSAKVTQVHSDTVVNLAVTQDSANSLPASQLNPTSVQYDAGLSAPGTWCWPA